MTVSPMALNEARHRAVVPSRSESAPHTAVNTEPVVSQVSPTNFALCRCAGLGAIVPSDQIFMSRLPWNGKMISVSGNPVILVEMHITQK